MSHFKFLILILDLFTIIIYFNFLLTNEYHNLFILNFTWKKKTFLGFVALNLPVFIFFFLFNYLILHYILFMTIISLWPYDFSIAKERNPTIKIAFNH
ncbi:hypothetical protein KUTeg_013568 [Tegillarca granosa]|uniref:Uncharacterized protein n=1 Tax=Tegillarca granosa TaxID=220873 RepID=A0ABQ9EU27_TEGGR|nr:hypothetical protein KUTeg_013568 [Tegillarca granosa]